jgi:GT2 family glycosyltransferase
MVVWESVADRILGDIGPATVLHVGCGAGFLVGALRQYGVEAFGIDPSEHAMQDTPPDVRPFCWHQSPTEPPPRTYDLIVCTDPLQTLSSSELECAIETLCRHSDDILFVRLTATGREDQCLDLRSPTFWVELFAPHSFYRDVDSDVWSIEPQALRFRRTDEAHRVVAAYERRLLLLQREAEARRDLNIEHHNTLTDLSRKLAMRVGVTDALGQQVRDWETRWTALEDSMGWRLLERLQRLRSRLAPPASRRDQLLDDMWRAIQMRQVGQFVRLVRSMKQQISWFLKASLWRLRLRADRPLRSRLLPVEPLEPRAPLQVHEAGVDIIVCVHNALSDVQRCLLSVMEHTNLPYSLILVDDGSGAETRDYLASLAQTHAATLLRNETPRGYTRAANQGLRQSSADYVVLLNSDTMVTPQWLDRLVACAESAPDIGLVGPLSNTASWQSIPQVEKHGDWAANPLPEGLSIENMGQLVAQYSARLYPTMPFLNGFCLLIRRQVLDQVGIFDAATFGEGYGEEDDLILRARQAGWRAALADDAYIYHAQSRSYSTERRKRLTQRAGPLLIKKHGQRIINEGVAVCQAGRVIEGIRARSQAMLIREEWIERGRQAFSGRRILFALAIAEAGGGGNVVIDEAKAMRRMGVDVNIFNLVEYKRGFERAYPGLDIPIVYGRPGDLLRMGQDYDAIIATYNPTVGWLAPLAYRSGGPVRGYYVQGFEPYMYVPGSEEYQAALQSYTLFSDLVLFTKTEWTRQEVQQHTGADCMVVGASVHIDLFRPRPLMEPRRPGHPLTITAMIRPNAPYREPRMTMEILRQASRRYRDGVNIVLFGTTLDDPGFAALPRNFAWALAGVLSQKQVARLLNEADVFVDFSSHQAMGLTALEAMACGAAVIVPAYGGAVEFARHEENSLVVDTSSAEASWYELRRLVENHDLRSRLQSRALTQVCDLFPERPALNILKALFSSKGSTAS